MQSVYTYYVQAQRGTAKAFAAAQPYLFLLKPPSTTPSASADAGEDFEDPADNPYFDWNVTSADGLGDSPPALRDLLVSPVVRASRFPPFNRVSVGRSRICDVIVPFPSVSKVHAHFHVEGVRVLALSDQRSSNGVFLNARRLAQDEVAAVHAGDAVRLGSMEFKLLDAAALYAFLRSFETR